MNIAKQIVDNQVINLLKENPEYFADKKDDERKKSKAFLLLAVSAFLETEVADAVKYITEGGSDGGFDAAYIIQEQESQISVVLFQAKYTRDLEKDNNFPANAVEKAVGTIKGVFDPNKRMDLNEESRKVVTDIHSYLLDGYIPVITYVCANNGLAWNTDAQNHIDNSFGNQSQVQFVHFNHDGIIKYTSKTKSVNASVQFKGKSIREDFNYKSVILGRVCVTEISKLMLDHGDILLEKNIRKFLGNNAVNEGIRNTLMDAERRGNFFFFNNGITMICSKFSANFLQENNWIVKIEDLQIINGGQTCKIISQIVRENVNADFSNVDVLVRLYEVSTEESVIQDITFATNSQSPVDFRDLRSNDDLQKLLEKSVQELGYAYTRKKGFQSGSQASVDAIPSSVAAEAVLAIWRDCPHIAKHKKHELFSTYYDKIFTKELNAAQIVVAVHIFRFCDNMSKKPSEDVEIQAQRAYSQYFMSTIIGRQLLIKSELTLQQITHLNFSQVKDFFEQNKKELYNKAEAFLVDCLHEYMNSQLYGIDGRTIAAVFRRFDIVEKYIKDCPALI